MNHSFNVGIAKEVGVNAAIVLENICFWVQKNGASGEHVYDGKPWTFSTRSDWTKLFPYLTANQVQTAVAKLKDSGFIEIGHYSTSPFDRTNWYTVTDKTIGFYDDIDWGSFINQIDDQSSIQDKSNHQSTYIDIDYKDIKDINIVGQEPDGATEESDDIPYQEIIDYLNECIGSHYRASTGKTRTLIKARFKEGFTLEDFKTVIWKMCREWKESEMVKYLRPETLFGTKFEGYLNRVEPVNNQRSSFNTIANWEDG